MEKIMKQILLYGTLLLFAVVSGIIGVALYVNNIVYRIRSRRHS
jgi:hypothetical protein